jgi:hypothetical protein
MHPLHTLQPYFPKNHRVKVKFSLWFLTEHHAMKAYWESGSITPLILDLGTR